MGRSIRSSPSPPSLAIIATHYERLGVGRDAGVEEIRTAYRRLARQFHPDAHGADASDEMAAINEAWRVLSDTGRRAVYDGSLRRATSAGSAAGGTAATASAPDSSASARYQVDTGAYRDDGRRARFPIWAVVSVVVLGAIFIFTAGALTDDPQPPAPDGLVGGGECVVIDESQAAVEVPCTAAHDWVVDQFVTADVSCPIDTREFRDRQGLGKVCVVAP